MIRLFKILFFGTAVLAVASVTSCKSKNNVVRADDYDSETIVDLMNEESPTIDYKSQLGNKRTGKAPSNAIEATPVDGQWTIVEAGGKEIRRESDMPYLIFSDAEKRFYASNGCNIINGSFSYDKGDRTVRFSNVLSSLASCPDIPYQQPISVVLNDGVSVKTDIENKGMVSFLYLKSKSDDLLLTLRRNNIEVLNGQWIVKKIETEDINNKGMNIFLDMPQLSIHGNTGCNYFNGKVEVNPFDASSISFTQMGVTMRLCDNADAERKMLVALEQATSYNLKSQDLLLLTDQDGKVLMELERDTTIK